MRRLVPSVVWAPADHGGRALARELVPLLAAVLQGGSLAAAARARALSYRGAWGIVEAAERDTGAKLVVLERGRGARLSAAGQRLVAADAAAQRLLATHAAVLRVAVRDAAPGVGTAAVLHVAASHDLALAALRGTWRTRHGVNVDFRGSAESLALYADGAVDVAGFHVSPGDHLLLGMLRPARDQPLRFLRRVQGLMLAPGNPHHVKTIAEVTKRGLRFVNRQPGSGTRLLFDQLLARSGLRPADVDGYANEEFTHVAVAATIAAGKADAGIGLEAAACEFGLAFVPLAQEDYLFVCRRRALRTPAIAAFRGLLAAAATAAAIARLRGYRRDDPGTLRGLARRADGAPELQ